MAGIMNDFTPRNYGQFFTETKVNKFKICTRAKTCNWRSNLKRGFVNGLSANTCGFGKREQAEFVQGRNCNLKEKDECIDMVERSMEINAQCFQNEETFIREEREEMQKQIKSLEKRLVSLVGEVEDFQKKNAQLQHDLEKEKKKGEASPRGSDSSTYDSSGSFEVLLNETMDNVCKLKSQIGTDTEGTIPSFDESGYNSLQSDQDGGNGTSLDDSILKNESIFRTDTVSLESDEDVIDGPMSSTSLDLTFEEEEVIASSCVLEFSPIKRSPSKDDAINSSSQRNLSTRISFSRSKSKVDSILDAAYNHLMELKQSAGCGCSCTEESLKKESFKQDSLDQDIYMWQLSNRNIVTLEKTLHTSIKGKQCWELLCCKLIDDGLKLTKADIDVCKFPGSQKIGDTFFGYLSSSHPDLTVDRIHEIAEQRNRKDISKILKPHLDKFKTMDKIPQWTRIELERVIGLSHYDNYCSRDGNWKMIGEDIGLDSETICEMELSVCQSLSGSSSLQEMVNLLRTRHPTLTLQNVAKALREIEINNAANKLDEIICEKQKEMGEKKIYTEMLVVPVPEQVDENEIDSINIVFNCDST